MNGGKLRPRHGEALANHVGPGALAGVLAFALAWAGPMLDAPPEGGVAQPWRHKVRTGDRAEDAYPPPEETPSPTASPSPTPPADGRGYLPSPAGVDPGRRVAIGAAPDSELLVRLQAWLDNGLAEAVAASAASARRPLLLIPEGAGDSEGVDALSPDEAARLLTAQLTGGPAPRIQALIRGPSGLASSLVDDPDPAPCVEILLHRFPGQAPWPEGPPVPTPDGDRIQEDRDPQDRVEGRPPPAWLAADAAAWRFCRAAPDQDWVWETWRPGGYHRLVAEALSRWPDGDLWLLDP